MTSFLVNKFTFVASSNHRVYREGHNSDGLTTAIRERVTKRRLGSHACQHDATFPNGRGSFRNSRFRSQERARAAELHKPGCRWFILGGQNHTPLWRTFQAARTDTIGQRDRRLGSHGTRSLFAKRHLFQRYTDRTMNLGSLNVGGQEPVHVELRSHHGAPSKLNAAEEIASSERRLGSM